MNNILFMETGAQLLQCTCDARGLKTQDGTHIEGRPLRSQIP